MAVDEDYRVGQVPRLAVYWGDRSSLVSAPHTSSLGFADRCRDLSSAGDLLERVLAFFKNESEDVRSAAAFAAGMSGYSGSGSLLLTDQATSLSGRRRSSSPL